MRIKEKKTYEMEETYIVSLLFHSNKVWIGKDSITHLRPKQGFETREEAKEAYVKSKDPNMKDPCLICLITEQVIWRYEADNGEALE